MSKANDPKSPAKAAIQHCPLCGLRELRQHSYTSAYECMKCGQFFFIGVLPNPKYETLFEEPTSEQGKSNPDVTSPPASTSGDESGDSKGKRSRER